MYDYILFDLDGTLTDPFEGITNSIIYALKKFGIEVSEKQKLKCFIGPPLYKSFSEYCGLSQEDSEKLHFTGNIFRKEVCMKTSRTTAYKACCSASKTAAKS